MTEEELNEYALAILKSLVDQGIGHKDIADILLRGGGALLCKDHPRDGVDGVGDYLRHYASEVERNNKTIR